MKAATERTKAKDGTWYEPAVHVVERDLKKLGYDFCWRVLDTKNYCLPQRRNRVWGIATVTQGGGGSTGAEVFEKYKDCLEAMKTNFQYDLELIFPPRPTEKPKPGRHTFLVEKAKSEGFQLTDIHRLPRQQNKECVLPGRSALHHSKSPSLLSASGKIPFRYRFHASPRLVGKRVEG